MINDENLVFIKGNLGDKPKLHHGKSLRAEFSVAQNKWKKNKNKEWENSHTNWFRVVVFGDNAKKVAKLDKGERVRVLGELELKSYTDKDGVQRIGTSVIANTVEKSALLVGDDKGTSEALAPSSNAQETGQ